MDSAFTALLDGLLGDKPLRAAFYSDRFLSLDEFCSKHRPVIAAFADDAGQSIDQATASRLAKRVWMALYFQ